MRPEDQDIPKIQTSGIAFRHIRLLINGIHAISTFLLRLKLRLSDL